VSVAILGLLMAMLLPSLTRAKGLARQVVCKSNIRQLAMANDHYAVDYGGQYVAAAPDIFEGFGGRRRWHGVRQSARVDPDPAKNAFDPARGPLRNSLGDGKVKECPEIVGFVTDGAANAFEASCGGYGYNSVGVGSRTYLLGNTPEAAAAGMRDDEIRQPGRTVMFADAAFVQGFPSRYLTEYSFCEPPRFVMGDGRGGIVEAPGAAPSIHFRHLDRAVVAWADGHVTAEDYAFTTLEPEVLAQYRIGWFGPEDNSLFDPR